jgi:undecaprenyl-diphosphatase
MTISEINIHFFRMINDLGKEYSTFNPVMIFIAEYMVVFLALAVIIYWLTRNKINRMIVLCAMVTFIMAELFGKLAGMIHSNNQPFAELTNVNKLIEKAVDNSFPSDHTMLFFSFCVSFWLFKRVWGFLWLVLATLVGVSRIWVGVHYPADVLVGATISVIIAIIVYKVVPKISIIHKFIGMIEKGDQFVLSALSKQKETKSKDV